MASYKKPETKPETDSLSGPTAAAPPLDTAAIREMLGLMKASLATIGQTFKTLNDQSEKITTLGPNKEDIIKQAEALEKQMKDRAVTQDDVIAKVRQTLRDDLKEKIAQKMRDKIRKDVESRIRSQAAEVMKTEIPKHLPVPLKEQAEKSKKQIDNVRHAFKNAEARRMNSTLNTSNLDDSLAVVVMRDGKKSIFYPQNIRSLLWYSAKDAQLLVQDYKLGESGSRETNINKFMTHIGVKLPSPILWMTDPVSPARV